MARLLVVVFFMDILHPVVSPSGGGTGWWWCALQWRVNKAVSHLRGVEPAVLLPVRLKGETAGRGVNLPVTSGTWTRDVGGILIRRAAYRRLAGAIWESL